MNFTNALILAAKGGTLSRKGKAKGDRIPHSNLRVRGKTTPTLIDGEWKMVRHLVSGEGPAREFSDEDINAEDWEHTP
jgi:hypothetical protein